MPNINEVMNVVTQLKSNPALLLAPRFKLPQGVNDPVKIIQHLLNTGQVSQAQVNRAMQMRNSPFFKQFR